MIYSQSTELEPLHFFIEVFLFGEYEKVENSFYQEWDDTRKREDESICIENEKGYIIHFYYTNEEHIPVPTKVYFESAFKELILQQFEISQNLIKRGIGAHRIANQSITAYLIKQSQLLKTLAETSNTLISDVVFQLNSFTKDIIISEILGIEYVQQFDNNDFYDDRLLKVLEVLGYLNGAGINQQRILSDSDYKRMLFYTIQMVQKESVPIVDTPFEKLQISNELLRYSYYVLHVEIFGIQPRKHFFTDFLEATFIQMRGIDSLSDKFAQKPRTLPEYVSEIIKIHFERKKK
ncbi:hypothetical protein D1614_09560 [Maribellus luteus]|uniref:Uncharacterized protein n=1 Tax=Maribellus luteus TaxID=2305463 RepID=A0A399T1V7_9BACT|nr:hypothetical protein [Maribellus luteus]RIJ48765.1 hypothetical protein D1614_09560 [Maribellus luteus]